MKTNNKPESEFTFFQKFYSKYNISHVNKFYDVSHHYQQFSVSERLCVVIRQQ